MSIECDSEVMKSAIFSGYRADLSMMPVPVYVLNRREGNPVMWREVYLALAGGELKEVPQAHCAVMEK